MRLSPLTNLWLLCLHIRWPAFLWIWKTQGINKVFKSAPALSLLFLYKFLKSCTWMTLFMEGLCDLVYFNCSSAFTKHLSSAIYTMITWSSAKKSVFTVWFFWNNQPAILNPCCIIALSGAMIRSLTILGLVKKQHRNK